MTVGAIMYCYRVAAERRIEQFKTRYKHCQERADHWCRAGCWTKQKQWRSKAKIAFAQINFLEGRLGLPLTARETLDRP